MSDVLRWPGVHDEAAEAAEAAGVAELLTQLKFQRRVFDRLDWWHINEWASSDAWVTDHDEAALLLVPIDLDHADPIRHTRARSAWVRWCAIADGRSASERVRVLFRDAAARLAQHGVRHAWCIARSSDWLRPYLRNLGYQRVDRMLTLRIHVQRAVSLAPPQSTFAIRDCTVEDLADVCALDAGAFDEAWRYPLPMMRRALEQTFSFTVAEFEGRIMGYQCALLSGEDGHIVRLAVRADARNQKLGSALLLDCLHRLARAGARAVTLNTQESNADARRLYQRLGFETLDETPDVLCKRLNALAVTGTGARG